MIIYIPEIINGLEMWENTFFKIDMHKVLSQLIA